MMNMLQTFVGLSLVLGAMSAAVGEAAGPQAQIFQRFHHNHILTKRQGGAPPAKNGLEELLGMENMFGPEMALPGLYGASSRITAFKSDIGPAELPIPGAKHLTLWYNGPVFPKQLDPKVLNGDLFYETLKLNLDKMYDRQTGQPLPMMDWSGRLDDFPMNSTIYSARLSLQDKEGNIVNVTSGVYPISVSVLQTTIEDAPLEACPGMLSGMPIGLGIFPHRWVDTIPYSGASLFTPADGSQPKTGLWSKTMKEMILTVGGVSLNPNKAISTVVRLDVDYAEGKPEVRTLRKELTLQCGKRKLEKMKGEGKTWIGKSFPIVYGLPDVNVFSIRGSIEDGGTEMKIKVNGKEVCTSKAEYIKIPSNPRSSKSVPTPGNSIAKMTECDTTWKLFKGDKIELETHYDFDKHPIPASVENYIIANNTFPSGMFEGIHLTMTRVLRFAETLNMPEWITDMTGI